ncbi:MFS transporter [Saccharothrix lopnurensis]|uniref:MFS transporter n=1 Tax=Saccharothrix lopnurensis TaxID=1670621 RepID=A0ABW1NYI2_9PSEU
MSPGGRLGAVRNLVVANGVTSFGASVTEFALPLVALTLLDASASTVALLYATSLASQALVSLPVGVWVDRADRARAAVFGLLAGGLVVLAVPALTAGGLLTTGWLFAVAVGVGVTSTVVQVAAQALVPALVGGQQLLSANAGLTFGRSLGTMVGPGAGGIVVGWIGAGFALLVDGVSQLLAALLLVRLRDPAPDRRASDRPRRAAWLGVQVVLADPLLRRILVGTTVFNVSGGLIGSLYFPYAYQDLGLSPIALGIAAMVGNVGLLAGSALAPRVVRRLGLTRAATLSDTIAVASFGLILSASLLSPLVVLAVYEFLFGLSISVFRVSVATLRQERTPDVLQGRVFSTVLLGPMFGAPVGAVLGAVLAGPLGAPGAIAVGLVVGVLSLTPYWLPGWRTEPTPDPVR